MDDCPLCGMEVPQREAGMIEEDMEYFHRTCIGCGRTFEEVREQLEEEESDADE